MNAASKRVTGVVTSRESLPSSAIEAFLQRIRREGRHMIWTGSTYHGSTPVLTHRDVRYQAAHIAWVLHHGTPPEGHVRRACTVPLCIAPGCLTDEAGRRRQRHLFAALMGRPLTGYCTGPGRHPRARYGVVRADGKYDCLACDTERRQRAREGCDEE